MNQRPLTAVLLAAGRGRRQRPYTDVVPKPLLSVNGRPTLDYILTAAAEAGFRSTCIVTHHLSEKIEEFVGDGAAWNMATVYCHQPTLAGTAHALKTAVSMHPALFARDKPFLLTATDYVLAPDYLAKLVDSHAESDADMTISLKRVPEEEIAASSSVQFQPNGRIGRIVEKPSPEDITSPLSASLTFVLPGAIGDYLPRMRPSKRGEFEIQSVMNQMLRDGFTASGLEQEAPYEWNEANDGIALD